MAAGMARPQPGERDSPVFLDRDLVERAGRAGDVTIGGLLRGVEKEATG
jgi:hypothetical protein